MPRTKHGRRRPRGEGTVFKNKRGLWVGRCPLKVGGLQRTGTIYARTMEEAIAKLDEMRRTGAPTKSKALLADFLRDTWLPEIKRTRRASTHERYESTVRLHVVPAIGSVRLADIDADTLMLLDAFLVKRRRSSAMRNAAFLVVSGALSFAKRRKLIGENPSSLVEAPRHEAKEVAALSLDDARRFVKAAVGEPYAALYLLAIACGLRQGEIFGLKRSDVDLERGVVAVRRSLREGRDGIEEGPPKTKTGTRSVDVPEIALAALRAHVEKLTGDEPYLFTAEKGGPLRKSVFVRKVWHPFLLRAKLPRMTFHSLRHTAATLRMHANVPARVTQETLGHSDVGTTLNTYSHVAKTMQKEAANLVSDLLSGVRQGAS